MKAVVPALTFLARHFLFGAFAMIVGCIAWTIAYIVMLIVAVVTNQGIGGPLAFPAGIMAVLAVCGFLGWGVFAPASAIGEIFRRVFRLPRIAAIPIVTVAAFLLSYVIYWAYIEMVTTHSMPSMLTVLKNFAIYLSIPLGAYWWLTEGPGALFDVFRRWIGRHRQNKKPSEQGVAPQPAARSESNFSGSLPPST
ncbi:hypothetical protein [Haloferula sargassicola]|uniref:Uncharacterized protein n=1 Tax=Haloferula sargassicola TaxID=490096 RepID=A0ABP9UVS2_9BACT